MNHSFRGTGPAIASDRVLYIALRLSRLVGFTFTPFRGMTQSEVAKVSREIHKQVSEEDLKRYAAFVLEESNKSKAVMIDFLSEEHPFIIEIFESTGTNEERRRFSLVVYAGFKKEKPVGLLLVDGLNCTKSEEQI